MKHLLIAIILIALCLPLLALKEDDILGSWYNGEKSSKIQIYKTTGGSYAGKIVWLKEPNDAKGVAKLDPKNPDKKLRGRALMNLVILTGLKSKGNDKFDGGKIYDPKSGNTYSCKGELENINTLKLRGFVGVSLIGRTDTWTRAK
ncbi:MAG TPA: DUF2147 domain-containing protein [Candidatus Cloacimonadota bacterium]|nr:DUF2147 domain-containing protein [Candidatus Cloacimonadota bacterium]HOH79544.1 DUF2147 domain-containing protein [Candidatus Cloacimonadota bacterium]